jgi:hypothetical protein
VFEIAQVTKEKTSQVKDCATLTLGASDDKPHKDDQIRKNEVQYDVSQEEYDSNVGSILEQLK